MFFWYENDDDNKDKHMSEILYVDFGKSDYIDKATILAEHVNTMYNAGVCTCI